MSVLRGDVTYRKEFSKTDEIIKKYTEKEEGISQMNNIIEELFGEELKEKVQKEVQKEIQKEIQKEVQKEIQKEVQKDRENTRKFYKDKIMDMMKLFDDMTKLFEYMRKQYEDDSNNDKEKTKKEEEYKCAIANMLKNNCSIDDIRNFILSYQ